MSILQEAAKKWLSDIYWFSRLVIRRPLHNYQLEPARAIIDSIINKRGLEFAVMFPRQSGKNETQSQIEAYLLNLFQRVPGAQIVKAQPTFKPQAINARLRLERALTNDWNRGQWKGREGYMIQLGQAVIAFFSADGSAVGATASLLLQCDEAQDVLEADWEKKFVPMAAYSNATTVFWGTAWTSNTLLARVIERLKKLEAHDGIRRTFLVGPDHVGQENPDYTAYVQKQIDKHGRNHPLVKSQYFNETVDADGGMFPAARRALMIGTHAAITSPLSGQIYAMLIDVAGEDEGATDKPGALSNPRRDSTALTIVEIDPLTAADPVLRAPTHHAVLRLSWTGVKHVAIYGQLLALAKHWRPRHVVIDATGVGAGLAAFLARALPEVVIPYEFNSVTKSRLGWQFLSIIETGRWKDYTPFDPAFENQLAHCTYNIRPGPNQIMQWDVPDGTRDTVTGDLIHDDLITSAALSAVLDDLDWRPLTGPTTIVAAADPLDSMHKNW